MKQIIVLLVLFVVSTTGFSQTTQISDAKFFTKKDNIAGWIGVGGFDDSFSSGYFQSAFMSFAQGLNGMSYFGEDASISKYEYDGVGKFSGGGGDGHELELALRFERIGGSQRLNSFQLRGGVRILEQNSNSVNKTTEQQNHVLGFGSIQWDINRNTKSFSRFVFGARMDFPIRASFERKEGTRTTTGPGSNLRSFRLWTEIGLHSFYLGKTDPITMSEGSSWAITASLTGNYTGRSEAPTSIVNKVQNGTTTTQVTLGATKNVELGAVIGLWRGRSELLRIGYSNDFTLGNASNSLNPKQVWYVAGDVWNGIITPLYNLLF